MENVEIVDKMGMDKMETDEKGKKQRIEKYTYWLIKMSRLELIDQF